MTNDYFKKRRKETGTEIVKQNFSTNAANISTKSVISSTNGFLGGNEGKNNYFAFCVTFFSNFRITNFALEIF